MWPQIDRPDYLPEEVVSWAECHRDLLELILAEFSETGTWPECNSLTRRLVREGHPVDVSSTLRGMPPILGFQDGYPERAVLLLFAFRLTSSGQGLLAGFIAALRLAAEKFAGDEEPPTLTRRDISERAFASEAFLAALSEILFREAPFLSHRQGAAGEEWVAEISAQVVQFWDITSADQYLRLRAEQLHQIPGHGPTGAANAEPPIQVAAVDVRDVFLSHAGEDKAAVATPLAAELERLGHSVWYDRAELVVGDSLVEAINRGLTGSRFGLLVLSPSFFAKPWPQRELDALFALMAEGRTPILPVWHGIDQAFLAQKAPLLAPLLAADTKNGIPTVAAEISAAISRPDH